MNVADPLLLANAFATWAMVGLIAFVDRVHYPMFARYGRDDYPSTQAEHERRTTRVVGPPMLVEALTAAGLPFALPRGVPVWQAWLGVALVGLVWASTVCWQIPAHRLLDRGFDAAAHDRLCATNRWRALAWLARGVLVAVMLAERLARNAP